MRVLRGHEGPVYRCIFSHDGNYALSAGHDKTVRLWNPHKAALGADASSDTALQVHSYEGIHGYEVVDVALSGDNATFLSCGGDKCCYIFDVKSGRNIRKLYGHEQRLNAVCLKRKDATVAMTASYDATVRIWDLRQHGQRSSCIQVLRDFSDSVTAVTCSEEEIIATSLDGCVRVYDLRAGKMHQDSVANADSERKPGGLAWVTVSNDDNCLLLSCLSDPAQLCLVEKSSGKKLQTYTGHLNTSYRLTTCFDNEDASVLSGSENGSILHWDLVSGKLRKTYETIHRKAVSSVQYHPTVKAFLSASYDGTCMFYPV